MSNKENIRKRCNCQCQEALINAKEDCRQFELKYNELRNEGERLYQQYEIKSSKLRETLEINHQLTDENQQLHDQNQGLAQRLVQVLQEKSNMEAEKQQEFSRLLRSVAIERQETSERFAALEEQHQRLIIELENSKQKREPPFTLEINMTLPTTPSASAARAAELNILDPKKIENMSTSELREQLDQVCISNELLRDEVRGLECKLRNIEQRYSAQMVSNMEKDRAIGDLKAKLEQVSNLEQTLAERQAELNETAAKSQQLSVNLKKSQLNVKELSDQVEELVQQIESERYQHAQALKDMENAYKQKEDLASNLVRDLEGKMHEVEEQSSLFVHTQSQIAVLKEQDQHLRSQLSQLQLAYRNSQDDLKRIYAKHKKDLLDLEETYKHGQYIERYEKVVLRCNRLESLWSLLSQYTKKLSETIEFNAAAVDTLKSKKEFLQKAWEKCLAQSDEMRTLKSHLASSKQSELSLNETCDHLMNQIASMEEELSVLRNTNQALQSSCDMHSKHSIVTDCKAIARDLVSNAVLQSELSSRLNIPDANRLEQQFNAELTTLEQLEWMIESEQAEVLRLKQDNQNLNHLLEQERELNKLRERDWETFSKSLEEQVSQLIKEKNDLKASCNGQCQKNEVPALQSRLDELNSELDVRQKEFTQLLKSNQRLEDHNTVLLSDLETSQAICRQRDSEIELLLREVSDSQSRLVPLEKSLMEAENFRHIVKTKMKHSEEEIEALRCSNSDLLAEIEELRKTSHKDRENFSERIASLQTDREKLETRVHELKLKDNARQGQIEAMECQKLKQQQQLKLCEMNNHKLHKQVDEISSERDKLKQRLTEMVKHKDQLLQEIDKLSRQVGEVDATSCDPSDYKAMKERYESKILKLKQAMLDYKTRGDRKITAVVQDLNMIIRRCDQLELCVAEIGRLCPQNAIIQSLVEEVERSKVKLRNDDKY